MKTNTVAIEVMNQKHWHVLTTQENNLLLLPVFRIVPERGELRTSCLCLPLLLAQRRNTL